MMSSSIPKEAHKTSSNGHGTLVSMFFRSRFCVHNFVKEDDVLALLKTEDKFSCKELLQNIFKDYLKELLQYEQGAKVIPNVGQSPDHIMILEGITQEGEELDANQDLSETFKSKREIFLEFMMNVIEFCSITQFSNEKCSTLIEVAYRTFYHSFTRRLTYSRSYDYFREVLLRHCHFRPPHSIYIFSLEEIKKITDFFITGFYRHYGYYLRVFTPHVEVVIQDEGMGTKETIFGRFPLVLDLDSGQTIKKEEVPALMRLYFAEPETKVSPEEMDEIMKGDSIYSPKKQKELMKKRKEEERRQKIDMVLAKELAKVQEGFESKLKVQDEVFLQKLEELKKPKKK